MAPQETAFDPRTPVLVGVGQSIRRPDGPAPTAEPVELMAEALEAAAADTGGHRDAGPGLLAAADSIRVSGLISWRYRDPGALVAERVGAKPAKSLVTVIGGNYVQSVVNRTAADILAGRNDVVLLTGAEAWRTRSAARRAGGEPDWTVQPPEVDRAGVLGDQRALSSPAEDRLGVADPTVFYPMVESALRAAAGLTVDEHRARIGRLWSRFSEVAADNPHAWIRRRYPADVLTTPSPDNRMVGFPYPKLLNSNLFVDQGAALILCSAARARAAGVPRDRWVFVHAGADAHDHWLASHRYGLGASPAIRLAGRAALDLAGTTVADLAHLDLYSCFPSAVQVAAGELGTGLERDLTVTGGMSFAGGPFNNYPMHAVATMADRLRAQPGALGLVSANGGFLTKHAFGIYGTEPPAAGVFRHAEPQAEVDALPSRPFDDAPGAATVEAYTVTHGRDGGPERAVFALRMPDGGRAWGTNTEPSTMRDLCREEGVGRAAHLAATGDVHLS